jgi:hypothetical protein
VPPGQHSLACEYVLIHSSKPPTSCGIFIPWLQEQAGKAARSIERVTMCDIVLLFLALISHGHTNGPGYSQHESQLGGTSLSTYTHRQPPELSNPMPIGLFTVCIPGLVSSGILGFSL